MTMLVLTRGVNEEIVISGGIRIVVLDAKPGRVRIGVCAPASVAVDREEVHARKILERRSAEPCTAGTGRSVRPH